MKTEQDLQNINAPQNARRQNQQHQHSHQKQLKVSQAGLVITRLLFVLFGTKSKCLYSTKPNQLRFQKTKKNPILPQPFNTFFVGVTMCDFWVQHLQCMLLLPGHGILCWTLHHYHTGSKISMLLQIPGPANQTTTPRHELCCSSAEASRSHASRALCLLQDCIAAAEKILQESKAEFSHMESYKSQLQLIWSREDVQSWLTLFTNIISDGQKALAAVVDASTAKDQVRIGVFFSSQLHSTFSVCQIHPGSHIE